MRSLRTILFVASLGCRSSRGIGIAALRTSSTLSKALPAGLMSFAVANRHKSSMTSYGSADLQELLGSYQSNINKFSIKDVSFINSSVAKSIDDDLMFNDGSFSLDQLMELAGLSVASAVHDLYSRTSTRKTETTHQRRILIISGPGNNGGDGLVAARHLKHFGYSPVVMYPKRSKGAIFENLVRQCQDLGIEVLSGFPPVETTAGHDDLEAANVRSHGEYFNDFDLIVDSIFGFSFEGLPRAPFFSIIAAMAVTCVPVISVDVPSGWHIERGDIHSSGLNPLSVISLTAPKECMRDFKGVHYIGGRFVPPATAEKYRLSLPDYGYGTNQIVVCSSVDDHGEAVILSEVEGSALVESDKEVAKLSEPGLKQEL